MGDLPELVELTRRAFIRGTCRDEEALREMLGQWASGLEPSIVFQGGYMTGLTIAGLAPGQRVPIVIARGVL